MVNEKMLEKLCNLAIKAREEIPGLTFDAFLNHYKTAQEITLLETKAMNSADVKSCKFFPKNFFNQNIQSNEVIPETIYCHNFFELTNTAYKHYQNGTVIICDDLLLWQMLQNKTLTNPIYAAFKATYHLFANQSLVCIFDSLNNSLLFPEQKYLDLELQARITGSKNISDLLNQIELPVRNFLERTQGSFKDFYNDLLNYFPDKVTKELNQFACLLDFIEQDHNLEWVNGLVLLAFATPHIKWGLEWALKFKPEEVVLGITQPLNAKFNNVLHEKLLAWRNHKKLCVYTNIKPKSHNHILLDQDYTVSSPYIENFNYPKIHAKPTLSARPNNVSATAIQMLMQDPYGFYARYILKLKNLNRIWDRNSPKDFGILTHQLIERSINFEEFSIDNCSEIFPLWQKRLKRILDWVKNQLHDLQATEKFCEQNVAKSLAINSKTITVNARLDALVKTPSGNLIVNFKTGTPPSKTDVLNGYAPQLAVEMFLARSFLQSDCQGEFWHLKGTQPVGVIANLPITQEFLENNIVKILKYYLCQESIFITCPWPMKEVNYNHYKHLERISDC
jgi:hypothetical protein